MNEKIESIMKKIYTLFTAAAALFAAVSCDLNLTPVGTLSYDPENTIVIQADIDGFEAGVIAQMRGLGYGVYNEASDIMMDYFNAVTDYGNNYGGIHRTDNEFSASDYDTRDNWKGPYMAIRHYNVAIQGCMSVPAQFKAKADLTRGEAYFGRAYAYLHLVRLFGKAYGPNSNTDLGVPIVLVYDQNEKPERKTVAEVYAQIKSDLDSAAVLLAGVKGQVRASRPTIDAVNALYARYYIDTKDYNNAAASAMKVISTGNYALAATADEMVKEYVNDEGTEPILQFVGNISEGGYMSATYYGGMANYTEEGYGFCYRPYFIPTETLVNSYDNSDLRLAQWFSKDDYNTYIEGGWYKGDFYVFKKYQGNPELNSGSMPNTAQKRKPLLISEMYLIAAEAYLAAGNTSEATAALNTIQNARHANLTTATTENIHKEWYRETVGEGLRMSCLKRWGEGYSSRPGQPGALSKGLLMTGEFYTEKNFPASDYHFLFPVPTHEMQVNPNLVQNEGYSAVSE